ncbi:CRTAC1 family protein [Pontibacter sp. G13]|uniref:CRTAC1 family protein n=1 Tax=Pontibacter sp. G13 TaxID=3074898 RepID=UPI00288944C5|nr:CRTAC1 family protein [Pontibacter sp. G13]WNJ19105.1 CRTAC1 family protein [Pontibacter sp. G13]
MNKIFQFLGIACAVSIISCGGTEPMSAQSDESAQSTTSASTPIAFTEITREAGIDFSHVSGADGEFLMPEIMGGGASFMDYNQDGYPDILLVGGGTWPWSDLTPVKSLRLYENQQDGTFKEVTEQAGLADVSAYAFGCTIGDIDSDGDEDIYVTALGYNLLLINEQGHFTDRAKQAGVQGKSVWSTASILWDADHDGHLDLYVGNYLVWNADMDRNIWCSIDGVSDNYCHPNLYEGEQGVFYRNNGDGTFADETAKRGFVGPNGISPIKTLGLTTIDVDHDGWEDLVMANDMQPDLLFRNKGDGFFEEIGTPAGIAYNRQGKPRAGMGLVSGDVDGSGQPSIMVGNFSRQPISVYRSLPNGMFMDHAYASQIGKPSFLTLTFGLTLFDADLDGDLDLFAANGHVFTDIAKKAADISFKQPPHFFVNNGQGIFADQAPEMGGLMQDSLVARASAVADIDQDGDLDLLVSENNGPVHLLRNDTERVNGYLRLLLRSDQSNPHAIGAEVQVFTEHGKRQTRRVKSSEGYLSQSEFTLTFGLGQTQAVDSVKITWPSGANTNLGRLDADQFLLIEEGKEAPQTM